MKNLHKKVGAGALVVLLLGAPIAYAGRFSGIYIPGGKVHENLPSSKQSELKVPFLLRSQLYVASDEEKARNDKDMVYGLGGIFDYIIYKAGSRPSDEDIKRYNYLEDLGNMKDGNENRLKTIYEDNYAKEELNPVTGEYRLTNKENNNKVETYNYFTEMDKAIEEVKAESNSK